MSSNNHSERSHALLSASGSHRWINCPRSALFSLQFPQQVSSKFAEEGTRAHELAENIFSEDECDYFLHTSEGCKKNSLEDIASMFIPEYGAEMVGHVLRYVKYVYEASTNGWRNIEVSNDLKWLHPELKKGTADAVIRRPLESIEVIDLKYGAGKAVSPYENTQLMIYALMAAYDPELGRIDETYETVKLTIVQPRCGEETIKSWELPIEKLIEFSIALKMAAHEAMQENAIFSSGDHCQWCPCAHACPELQKVTFEVVSKDFDMIPDVNTLNDEQIANVLKHKKTIEGFIKACEDHAFSRLAIGEKVPGLKLVRGRGSRDWNLPQEKLEEELLKITTPDVIYESGIKSVAKIEKETGKKAIAHLIASCEGKLTVVHEADKREAVTVVSKDEFNEVTIEGQNNLLE